MIRTLLILNALLVALMLIGAPTPSSAFGMMKGGGHGGGSSGVAEILAAGLITSLLMDRKPKSMPMIHHVLAHPLMGGYRAMPPQHHMPQPMYAGRIPMMNPYVMPMMPQQRYNMMNQAIMSEVNKQQALASRLNEEIQALQEQESILEAAIARAREGSEAAIKELLEEDEDTIPAAALLLETAEFMTPTAIMENPHPMPPPEMFQAAPSEPESRYILPRIVRHFVQRLMRRGENH